MVWTRILTKLLLFWRPRVVGNAAMVDMTSCAKTLCRSHANMHLALANCHM